MIKKNENIILRKIHGSVFLIDISDNYFGDQCAIYEINETGMFLWNSIDGTRTAEDLTDLLKSMIIDNVDYEILYADVVEFIDTLKTKHFIEV